MQYRKPWFKKTNAWKKTYNQKLLKTLEQNKYGKKIAQGKKTKPTVNLKAGRFDTIDSGVVDSIVRKAIQDWKVKTLFTLLMITVESTLSKRPVLRITEGYFSSSSY